MPAVLAAPDSREQDVLRVLHVLERWEEAELRAENWLCCSFCSLEPFVLSVLQLDCSPAGLEQHHWVLFL